MPRVRAKVYAFALVRKRIELGILRCSTLSARIRCFNSFSLRRIESGRSSFIELFRLPALVLGPVNFSHGFHDLK